MRGEILLFLTLSGLWSLYSCEVVSKFHYVTEKKNWTDAQSYCRNNYHDLASLLSMEDISSLLKNRELHIDRMNSTYAWIGLSDDPGNWTWSLNGAGHHRNTHFTKWKAGYPALYSGHQICTIMDPYGGYWHDVNCDRNIYPVCYDGSAYFVHKTRRSWFEAQAYCRDKYMDLASVMDETEAAEIVQKMVPGGPWSWIGLYRKPWAYWSDQLSVNFTHWQPNEPKSVVENCVVTSTHTGKWFSAQCDKKFPFVCQENVTPQHKARLTVKISSGADVNDPEVQRQLLQQVHAMLEKQGMSDFKLRWTQRDGNIFHKEPKKKN